MAISIAITNLQLLSILSTYLRSIFRIVKDVAAHKEASSGKKNAIENEKAQAMNWIASEGGPLICLEVAHQNTWGGIERLSVPCQGAKSDYDRVCQASAHAAYSVPLVGGAALALGMGSLDTAVWTTASGSTLIVSVVCAEPDVDESQWLGTVDESIFDHPLESTRITFSSGHLTLFDSADLGDEPEKKSIMFELAPGRYQVLSQTFDPHDEISFVLHKFSPLA